MSRLDELLRQANEAEPDPLHPAQVDRVIARSATAGRARHRGWVMRRVTGVAAVSAALAAAAATIFMLTPAEPAPSVARPGADASERATESPTRLELETGDRLMATEGARFTVERATRRERLIELGAGSMMFDVQPIEDGMFTVVTSDARVTVLGTVFTVHADEQGTTVRVYEGRVRVEDGDRVRIVTSGGTARVGETPRAPTPDPLAEPARDAAAERTARLGVLPRAPIGSLAAREPTPVPANPALADEARALEAPAPEPSQTAPNRGARTRSTPHVAPVATADDPPPAEAGTPALDPAAVRAMIAAGDPRGALAVARSHTDAGQLDPWLMLEADALRALRDVAPAARTYARAAETFASPRRQQAGYLAARLLATQAPLDALAQLDAAGVTAAGSPLRERGLALRVDLLGRLARADERADAARTYLSLYPDGSRADRMRSLMSGPGVGADP